MTERAAHSAPRRAPNMSSLFRRAAHSEISPEVELKEVLIPRYELEWAVLKSWLDERFKSHNCTFTERYNVLDDKYVVYLPEHLTEDDEMEIAFLKSPRGTAPRLPTDTATIAHLTRAPSPSLASSFPSLSQANSEGEIARDLPESSTGKGARGTPSDASSSSGNINRQGSAIFDTDSLYRAAFTSTLPTSKGVSKPAANFQTSEKSEDARNIRDTDTIYSVESAHEHSEYVLMFAHRLAQDVINQVPFAGVLKLSHELVSEILGLFAWKLYQESTKSFQWEACVTLHRERNKISRILTKNEDSAGSPREDDYEGDNESRTPFVKSRQELFQWVDGVLPEPDDEIQQTPEIIDTEGLQLPHSADVERSIHQSDAYRWLLSKISQHVTLSYGAPNVMAEIRTSVSNQLQLQNSVRSMSRHRPSSLVEVTFHLEWNPKRYIQGLGFRSSPSSTLDNVYSLTGTWCEAQVLSVSDYIHQTWPVTGYPMKYVLQELIAIPEGEQCTYEIKGTKGAHINARIEKGSCTISVTAGAHFVSEAAEQIAWLAATLRPSTPGNGVLTCCPHIKALSISNGSSQNPSVTTTASFSFSFSFEHSSQETRAESGFCWGSLFRNPILVPGFPILSRPQPATGLEMSLAVMSYLLQSDQLIQCEGRLMIKGHSLLLVATLECANVVLWHLFTSATPGERISYFDEKSVNVDISQCNIFEIRALESSRHVVGWCAKATDLCGHPAANCSVSASRLQPSPSSIVIDRLYIEGGAQIVGGITLRPNQKEQPIKLHRERDYPELLETIAAHPVAFYDVTDRRAWLIDGASALLYLVRISLHLDAKNTESTYDWVFDASKFEYNRAGSNGRIAAIKTLKSWSNRDLQLYVKKQTTNNNGDVIQEFSTLGDRIDKILHWLELLMDRDVYLALRDGITVSQTLDRRRSISGYDLLDVIKPPGPITTRATHLLSSGDGWFDLFPTIRATTILGRDFGNLILPDEPNQICANWRSIPTGLDYMTVSMSTLKMVYDKRIQTSATTLNKGEITKNILWASPCPPFRPCYCIQGTNGGKQKHLDPVQFLISRKSWIPTPKPKDETLVDIDTLESTGAVVFANLPLFGRKPTSTAEDAGDPSSSASGVHTQKKRWKSFRGLLGMKKSEGDS